MVGQMKRCRPAFEGQSNSNLMEPLALEYNTYSQSDWWSACAVDTSSLCCTDMRNIAKAREDPKAQMARQACNLSVRILPALAGRAVGIICPSIVEGQSESKASDGRVDGMTQDVEHL